MLHALCILEPFQLVSAVCSAIVEQEAARFPLLELPDGVLSHLMLVAEPVSAMGLGSACLRLNHILRDCRLEVRCNMALQHSTGFSMDVTHTLCLQVLLRMLDARKKATIEEMTGQLCAQEPGLQLRGFTMRAHTLRTGPTTAAGQNRWSRVSALRTLPVLPG